MSETRAYFHNIRDTVTPNTQAREPGYLRIRPLVLTTTNKVIVDLV